jgi:O-antigen/teichoic acid export membrane protein
VRRLFDRLPEGTFQIGSGLVVNGVTAYAFVTLSARALGVEAYSPVALLWALTFLLGVGFFMPLEQETARIVAERAAGGMGAAPVVRSAAVLGSLLVSVFILAALAASSWMVEDLFEGEALLFVGLLVAVTGVASAHLVKGVLAGLGHFSRYGWYLVGEGLGRVALLALILILVRESVGIYGLAIGLAPFLGIGVALGRHRGLLGPGPAAHLGDLSKALGSLLVASVATALVLNSSPVVVELLANDLEADEPGRFLNALLIARIPLFFFQAVQASLLPKLSGLAASGRLVELWGVLKRLLVLVVGMGVMALLLAASAGPWVVELAFGQGFAVSRTDMVLLTLSSAVLMVALSLAQGLIACRAQGKVAVAWVIGLLAFPVAVALEKDLFLRVELGLVATVSVSSLVMAVLLMRRLHDVGLGQGG